MNSRPQPLMSIALLLTVFILSVGHFSSLTQGHTGAPGDVPCIECHTSPLPTISGGAVLEGLPAFVIGGQAYALRVVMHTNNTAAKTAGFQITFLNQNGTSNGMLQATGPNVEVMSFGNRQYAQHSPAVTFNSGGVGNEFEFQFIWTPEDVVAPKNINGYAATLLGNGNYMNTDGTRLDSMIAFMFNTTIAPELLGSVIPLEVPACHGDPTGVLQVIASGGIGPLAFAWSNGETTSTNSNLQAGMYSVTITDQSNQQVSINYNLTEPDALGMDATITSPACHDSGNGSIDVMVSGGTPPYSYTINGITASEPFGSLEEGIYTIVVEDDHGCTFENTYAIDAPDTLEVGLDEIQHQTGSMDGHIYILVSGGTEPYSYFWEAENSTYTNVGHNIDNLDADTYNLTVTDFNGCEAYFSAEVLFITATSSPEENTQAVQVTPNPGRQIEHIVFPASGAAPWSVDVFTPDGQHLTKQEISAIQPELSVFESQHWKDGLYILVFEQQQSEKRYVVRWIKQ